MDLAEVEGIFEVEKVEDMVGLDNVEDMVGMRTLVIDLVDMVVVGIFRVDTVVEGILSVDILIGRDRQVLDFDLEDVLVGETCCSSLKANRDGSM